MNNFGKILLSAQNSSALIQFIEGGNMADMLADIHLSAARNSLSKANLAVNPKGQIWNAVGQLEVAYQAYHKVIDSFTKVQIAIPPRVRKYEDSITKARYTLCIMAVCYSYLGEKLLCDRHLSMALSEKSKLSTIENELLGLSISVWILPMALAAITGIYNLEELDAIEVSDDQINRFRSLVC